MTNPTTYTLCDNCPLCYDTISCKLGYDNNTDEIDGYDNVSANCGLTVIVWLGGEFRPTTIEHLLQ